MNELTGVQWDDYIRIDGYGNCARSASRARANSSMPRTHRWAVTPQLTRWTSTRQRAAGRTRRDHHRAQGLASTSGASATRCAAWWCLSRRNPASSKISAVYRRQPGEHHQPGLRRPSSTLGPPARWRRCASLRARRAPPRGANGNEWVIFGYDDRPGADSRPRRRRARTPSISPCSSDANNKVINYLISERTPTRDIGRVANLLDLASALNRNSTFRSNFTVDYVREDDWLTKTNTNDTKDTPLGATDTAGVKPDAAVVSAVGVLVRFNDAIQSLTGDGRRVRHRDRPGASWARPAGRATLPFSAPTDEPVHHLLGVRPPGAAAPDSAFRIIMPGRATNYHDADDDLTNGLEGTPSNRLSLSSFRPDSRLKPEELTAAQLTDAPHPPLPVGEADLGKSLLALSAPDCDGAISKIPGVLSAT